MIGPVLGGPLRYALAAPLLAVSLAFVAGIATAHGFDSGAVELAALAGLALAGGLLTWRRERTALALAVLLPLIFAAGLARADDGPPRFGSIAAVSGERVEVTGLVAADPERRGTDQRLRIDVERLSVGAEEIEADGTVLIRASLGPSFAYGDRLRVATTLHPVPSAPPELRDLLAERGISATGTATGVTVLAHDQGNPLRAAVGDARADVDRALAHALDEPLAGLAQGITTGRRNTLDPALRADLNDTSLSHLVVISGSNVTILATLIVALLAWATGRRWAVVIAIASLGVYTVFVGADAPVVRAAIMASLFLVAGIAGRRSSAVPAVALAAAVMLALTPSLIADLSFQLSFAATSALALLATPLHERITARLGAGPESRLWGATLIRVLVETTVITVVATAATLPLIALYFERISLVAIPANLLVAPIFPLIFLGSLLTGVAGAISEAFGLGVGWLFAWLPLSWFVEVAQWLADLPFAAARIEGFSLWHAFVLYGVLIACTAWLYRGRPPGRAPRAPRRLPSLERPLAWLAAGVLIAVNVVVWSAVVQGDDDDLLVYALDVGQGDATLIRDPAGLTLLVDGGPDERVLIQRLAAVLPAGQRSIEAIVATHPQADHITGLFGVLDRYRVGTLYVSPAQDRTELGRRLVAAAIERGVPVEPLWAGMQLRLSDDTTVDVLAPSFPLAELRTAAINDTGVVLRLTYGDVRFLFTADLEAPAELRLATAPGDLAATVLKVGHHGSATSTTDLLLRRVQPAVAIISVGANNRFGHPHAGVIDRLAGVTVLRTDQRGTVTFRSDGVTLRISSDHPPP